MAVQLAAPPLRCQGEQSGRAHCRPAWGTHLGTVMEGRLRHFAPNAWQARALAERPLTEQRDAATTTHGLVLQDGPPPEPGAGRLKLSAYRSFTP